MGYSVKIVAHSAHPDPAEPGLLSAEIRFPRIVLAEVVTHRVCRDTFGEFVLCSSDRTTTEDISKNSASSRAIPVAKMIQAVQEDPYVPDRFSATGPGMQGAGWLEGDAHRRARDAWLRGRDLAVLQAQELLDAGVHKQDANRLLEPFAWVTQLLTADTRGWANFFALRCDAAAHPAFQRVARMLFLEYRRSAPVRLGYGQWHLPYTRPPEREEFRFDPLAIPGGRFASPADVPDPIQFSAARCAWLSYENHERDGSADSMRRTFDRLLAATPRHASPIEHQAAPLPPEVAAATLRSNLSGWVQARKLVPGERADEYRPSDEEVASWGLE